MQGVTLKPTWVKGLGLATCIAVLAGMLCTAPLSSLARADDDTRYVLVRQAAKIDRAATASASGFIKLEMSAGTLKMTHNDTRPCCFAKATAEITFDEPPEVLVPGEPLEKPLRIRGWYSATMLASAGTPIVTLSYRALSNYGLDFSYTDERGRMGYIGGMGFACWELSHHHHGIGRRTKPYPNRKCERNALRQSQGI